MAVGGCIPAPHSPRGAPSDWDSAVQGNCFTNIERLGQWTGGQTSVPSGTDPSPYFRAVAGGSLGGGANPPTIYVLVHGWAPGYRTQVKALGGNLQWWGSKASVERRWASDWAWSPVTAQVPAGFTVNDSGVVQSISSQDSNAVVLAYSWIDDSATDSGLLDLDEVYQSEAYTHANGIRLASALMQAIAPSFWNQPSGLVRLIGHSHGSKVATVAALTLQHLGRRVASLTICDSPDSWATREANAANLLGFYLEKMQIANPSWDCAAGAFVSNHASYFGVAYAGTPNLAGVVEVALDASSIYHWVDRNYPGNCHTYAAAWYGGAAKGAALQNEPPVGLGWPPPPKFFRPALNQNWRAGTNQHSQWNLQTGSPLWGTCSYSTELLPVVTTYTQGNVRGSPSTSLVFGPTKGSPYAIYEGQYSNDSSSGWGVAFDLLWTAPQIGDYLVVGMASRDGTFETLLVIDGQSFANASGLTPIAVNTSHPGTSPIGVYFCAAQGNTIGQVSLTNFRLVNVSEQPGSSAAALPPPVPSSDAPPEPQ